MIDFVILEFREMHLDLIALYLPTAEAIFFVFAGLELAWGLVEWASQSQRGITALFTGRLLVLLLFHTILLEYEDLASPIVLWLGDLGLAFPGWSGFNPREIMLQGWVLAITIWDRMDTLATVLFPPAYIVRILAPGVVLMTHYIISIKVAIVLCEQYLALGSGVLFMGFSSSKWTWGAAKGVIAYLVSVGIKVMMLGVVLGAISLMGVRWLALVQEAPFFSMSYWLSLNVEIIAVGYLAWRVPDKVAKRISDSFIADIQNPYRG